MNKHQRSWLAFANSKVCRHANAIHDKGFINWGMKDNFHFSVGDIIYLFVSNERRVMFQMEVIAENCLARINITGLLMLPMIEHISYFCERSTTEKN